MLISIRNLEEILGDVWVLKPKRPYYDLTQGYMYEVENDQNKKDDFIVNLQVDGQTLLIHVHLAFTSRIIDHSRPPFRAASDDSNLRLVILYDSPPSSLVMSASVDAVYMVLKPVYTAICSVTE